MNKTESAYANCLEAQKHKGEVLWYKFEGIKLRLADKTFFSPDFFVLKADGALEVHEVKPRSGSSYFAMDDSKVKIKVAADAFPFSFFIVWPNKQKAWELEQI